MTGTELHGLRVVEFFLCRLGDARPNKADLDLGGDRLGHLLEVAGGEAAIKAAHTASLALRGVQGPQIPPADQKI